MKVTELRDIILNRTYPNATTPFLPPEDTWDPYANASSFYGSGAFLCWLLVSASYVLKWGAVPTEPNYFPLTSDFFAMLAYPTIAAGHSIILAATFPSEERHSMIATMVAVRGPMNETTMTDNVATTISTLQDSVALAAPLRVCEFFFYPGLFILMLVLLGEGRGRFPPRLPLLDLLYVVFYGTTVLAVIIVIGVGVGGPVGNYLGFSMISQMAAYVIVAAPVGLPVWAAKELWGMRWHWRYFCRDCDPGSLPYGVLGLIMFLSLIVMFFLPFLVLGFFPQYVIYFLSLSVPDVGVSLFELDQAAAACVGFITLGISMYEVSKVIPRVARLVDRCKIWLGILVESSPEENVPLDSFAEVPSSHGNHFELGQSRESSENATP